VAGAGVTAAGRARSGGRGQEGGEGGGRRRRRGRGRAGGRRGRAEERADDAVGDGVELGDGGAHAGRQVAVFLLVALGPDAAQTVEGLQADKQILEGRTKTKETGCEGRKLTYPFRGSFPPLTEIQGHLKRNGGQLLKTFDITFNR